MSKSGDQGPSASGPRKRPAGSKSGSRPQGSRQGGRPAQRQGGGRPPSRGGGREVIVVKQTSPALIAILAIVAVIGIVLGVLVYLDMTRGTAGQPGAPGAQQPQQPNIAQLEAAVQASPTDINARTGLGIAYLQAGRVAEAKSAFQKVLETDPKNYTALDYMGLVSESEGSTKDALAYYDKALEVPSDDKVDALYDKGQLLFKEGRFQETIAVFERFIKEPRIKGTPDEAMGKNIIDRARNSFDKGGTTGNSTSTTAKP